MRILARELEVVEEDIDYLYDNWFIETCEDWVVPYIGDLVGARRLRPFGDGGGALRAYVANTLSYRQAKGTVAVLEQLTRDVTGWPAHAVEFFRRLIQVQNVNHVRPDNLGTVSVQDADGASQAGGPFESTAHNVDVRAIATGEGRYNIPNVGLFVWRLQSLFIPYVFDGEAGYRGAVQPKQAAQGAGHYHLDPIGRDLQLFNRSRTEPALAHLAMEVDLPGPLRRRPLHDDLDELRSGMPGSGAYFGLQPVLSIRLDGGAVPAENLHCCNLEDRDDGSWRRPQQLGEVFFDPVLGRLSLHEGDEERLVEASYAYGAPHEIGGGPYDRRASWEEWRASLEPSEGESLWQVGVTARSEEITDDLDQGGPVVGTIAEAIERWNEEAGSGSRGIIAIMDSATYREDLTDEAHHIRIPAGAWLAVVAASWPAESIGGGVRRRAPGVLAAQDRRPHIASGLAVSGEAEEDDEPGTLIFDGVLVEGIITVRAGNLGRLELRHSTAGAAPAGLVTGIEVMSDDENRNARLSVLLKSSVSGRVDLGSAAATFEACDSILGEDKSANPDPDSVPTVLAASDADVVLHRCTVLGRMEARTLDADDTLFVGRPDVSRRQCGCLRFCYLPSGARTPRRYRCVPDLQISMEQERLERKLTEDEERALRIRLRPVFTSSAFGTSAFGQLALNCPAEILEGGESEGEIGAMNALGNPARIANLRDALEEYLPFGLEAGLIYVT